MKRKGNVRGIRVEIAGDVLESVFKECDRHDHDETGGRIVGHFAMDCGTLVVRANGMIEPGPNARRTPTSFFQDGDHQTQVFRRLEARDPAVEHLGNWHTHHVNGYPTLSAGDVSTYRRIVNHKLHNLDFFYALLVTHRARRRSGIRALRGPALRALPWRRCRARDSVGRCSYDGRTGYLADGSARFGGPSESGRRWTG